ncbi:MAG TPA: hypothetical protein VFA94_11525 [Acidimicrobiales bacterium]|nr:hypothetical protein [Acidimicrobiales bacterium]
MTFVTYRRIVQAILALVLVIGGALLLWGSSFGTDMVKSQLSAEKIYFPAKGTTALDPKEFPDLQQYAGQMVDNGPKAKAYANGFIKRHLSNVAAGKTYSEVSTLAQQNPTDTKLAAQAQTLFRGETLRGLLLYAWGWSVVSRLAFYAALGAFLGFAVMVLVIIGDFFADPKVASRRQDETSPVRAVAAA